MGAVDTSFPIIGKDDFLPVYCSLGSFPCKSPSVVPFAQPEIRAQQFMQQDQGSPQGSSVPGLVDISGHETRLLQRTRQTGCDFGRQSVRLRRPPGSSGDPRTVVTGGTAQRYQLAGAESGALGAPTFSGCLDRSACVPVNRQCNNQTMSTGKAAPVPGRSCAKQQGYACGQRSTCYPCEQSTFPGSPTLQQTG